MYGFCAKNGATVQDKFVPVSKHHAMNAY